LYFRSKNAKFRENQCFFNLKPRNSLEKSKLGLLLDESFVDNPEWPIPCHIPTVTAVKRPTLG